MKCCICGQEILFEQSHNPNGSLDENAEFIKWKPEDRCCEKCNAKHVIPGRIYTF